MLSIPLVLNKILILYRREEINLFYKVYLKISNKIYFLWLQSFR